MEIWACNWRFWCERSKQMAMITLARVLDFHDYFTMHICQKPWVFSPMKIVKCFKIARLYGQNAAWK